MHDEAKCAGMYGSHHPMYDPQCMCTAPHHILCILLDSMHDMHVGHRSFLTLCMARCAPRHAQFVICSKACMEPQAAVRTQKYCLAVILCQNLQSGEGKWYRNGTRTALNCKGKWGKNT